MADIISVVASLPKLLSLSPANDKDIFEAEKQLNLKFSTEYKKYLKKYGAIIADGIELTGIAKSERCSVVNVTKREQELNKSVPRTLYVVESLGIDGIVLWQNEKGEIFQTTPSSDVKKIADSLAGYLQNLH